MLDEIFRSRDLAEEGQLTAKARALDAAPMLCVVPNAPAVKTGVDGLVNDDARNPFRGLVLERLSTQRAGVHEPPVARARLRDDENSSYDVAYLSQPPRGRPVNQGQCSRNCLEQGIGLISV